MPAGTIRARRYLLGFVLGFVVTGLFFYLYTSFFKMGFLGGGYPAWRARETMLERCDLGSLALFGDSQLEAAIAPADLPVIATNFSAGGLSPLDSYYVLKRAMRCPSFPKHVVISFGFGDFGSVQAAFWENSVLYGIFLGQSEIGEIEATARRLHDRSFGSLVTYSGLTGWWRDFAYANHLPFLYFSSLVKSGFFQRYAMNEAMYEAAFKGRGRLSYAARQDAPHPYNGPDEFHSLPIQAEYFKRMLDDLEQADIRVDFVLLPMRGDFTPAPVRARIESVFIDYLRGFEASHPHFHLAESRFTLWPENLFIDESHLNPDGARLATAIFSKCLAAWNRDHGADPDARDCDFALTHGGG